MREQAEIIRWEDPPPARSPAGRRPGRSVSRWDPVVEELRDRPGRWAVVAEGDGRPFLDLATRISRATLVPFSPPRSFETATRQAAGRITVYARYVGDGDA